MTNKSTRGDPRIAANNNDNNNNNLFPIEREGSYKELIVSSLDICFNCLIIGRRSYFQFQFFISQKHIVCFREVSYLILLAVLYCT
jgi:hypothetical protein